MSAIKLRNKIYIILIVVILIVIAIVAILLINNSASRVVISNEGSKQLINTNALTMMYETEAGSGEYQVSSDTTWPQEGYTFNERLSGCENGSQLAWDDENKRVIVSTSVSDKCYVYFDKMVPTFADICREENSNTLACKVATNYTTDGENGLYYHDGTGSYTNADQEAGDNSYRYAGANPNNYVCFGATGADCQDEDNQYRIIGVFNNQVKLIKATSYGDYAWNPSMVNEWNENTKPDIYATLNTTYYNTIPVEWQNLIAESTWQVGGMNFSNTNTAKQYYDVEVGTGQSGYEETMKIGLMYVSDYGYGASPEKWTTALYEDNYGTDNWIYFSSNEWTISQHNPLFTFSIDSSYGGRVIIIQNIRLFAVRPSFYLNSTVTYISGSGTQSDPFRIA
mgnify:FL=1